MAGSTGLEPATSGLTVQCANQAAPRARFRNQRLRPGECITTAPLCPELCPCPGGPELLRAFHQELLTTAPSEMPVLFEIDQEATAPPVEEPRHERVVFQAGR